MRQIFGFFVGICTGWLVGGGIALLLAPSTGEDLRSQIQGRATGLVDEVKAAAESRRAVLEQRLAMLRAPHPPVGD